MTQVDAIIHARWVLPIVPKNTLLENHAVVLDKGRILDILPSKVVDEKYTAKAHFDRSSHVLMPGLINTHTHTPMNLFRGLADDLDLMDWLQNHIWPAEQAIIGADSVFHGSQLAIAEMLRGGTTCFNDHYFFPLDIARAAQHMGIRASIGHVVMNVPTDWAKDENGYIERARKAHESRPDSPLLSWMIAPHAPYTNSDKSLSLAKEMADEFNLRLHMHLHETSTEVEIDVNQHGKRPMQRLYDLGLLDERFLAVHMVHLTPEEIQMAKETGLHIAHNPESNLKLASGFAPVNAMLDAGINVCLGTDGAASNNDLDMFAELRTASLLAKAQSGKPTAVDAMTALEMATINGARALGLDKEIGSIEIGKSADLITVNLDSFLTQPIYNPISHLAYAINQMQVTDNWVAGNQLLANGNFTQCDIAEIVHNVKPWAEKAMPFRSTASTTK